MQNNIQIRRQLFQRKITATIVTTGNKDLLSRQCRMQMEHAVERGLEGGPLLCRVRSIPNSWQSRLDSFSQFVAWELWNGIDSLQQDIPSKSQLSPFWDRPSPSHFPCASRRRAVIYSNNDVSLSFFFCFSKASFPLRLIAYVVVANGRELHALSSFRYQINRANDWQHLR